MIRNKEYVVIIIMLLILPSCTKEIRKHYYYLKYDNFGYDEIEILAPAEIQYPHLNMDTFNYYIYNDTMNCILRRNVVFNPCYVFVSGIKKEVYYYNRRFYAKGARIGIRITNKYIPLWHYNYKLNYVSNEECPKFINITRTANIYDTLALIHTFKLINRRKYIYELINIEQKHMKDIDSKLLNLQQCGRDSYW